MEHESVHSVGSEMEPDLEDGEIDDSDDGYTPLVRPMLANPPGVSQNAATSQQHRETDTKMDASDDIEFVSDASFDSSDSDADFRSANNRQFERQRIIEKPRPSAARLQAPVNCPVPTKRKNYNIWSSGLQEDALTENLKGCDVAQDGRCDRNVESYDYSLKYRLNGENCLKRRQSNTTTSESTDSEVIGFNKEKRRKRYRTSSGSHQRGSVKDRIGVKLMDNVDNVEHLDERLDLSDLELTESMSLPQIVTEFATKLGEEKDDLLTRVITVLGTEIPSQIYKETQKIESKGGMMIMNGGRRRTPGGVFLFLLKRNDDITKAQIKEIFRNEHKYAIKNRKLSQALKRDQKVEELKKSLKIETEPQSHTRKESLSSHLKPETHPNLSNPPPSPVMDGNRENSSDFDTHAIQHMNVTSPEKPLLVKPAEQNASGNSDILELNCDMDLF